MKKKEEKLTLPLHLGSHDAICGEAAEAAAMAARIYPVYGFGLIASTIALVTISATIVSFLPSKKIARMDPVDALKGKMQ